MANYPFRLVNVFTQTEGGLTGNPLCVFEDAAGLSTQNMQALARQFNLSETTFVLPSLKANASVRIFTPSYEMPFAGHPTLGTAHVCRALGLGNESLSLEMQAGVIPVVAVGDRWTLQAPVPTWRELKVSRPTLAYALGLDEADIIGTPLWVKAGKEQLIIPLGSLEAVNRATPRSEGFAEIQSEDGKGMAYVFAETGAQRTTARFFFPEGAAMLEDPATGSATANFGGWCIAMNRRLPLHVEIAQGALVGRPSTLYLDIGSDQTIRVSGNVVDFGRGSVTF